VETFSPKNKNNLLQRALFPNVHAAGDAACGRKRQIVLSVGQAITATLNMMALKKLKAKSDRKTVSLFENVKRGKAASTPQCFYDHAE
jgi:hypothetical protein